MTEHPFRLPFSKPDSPTHPISGLLTVLLMWNATAPAAIAQRQPSGPTLTPASLGAPAPYTLGAGDLLQVDLLDVPEYSGEYLILSDGTLNLPLVGRLEVAGLPLSQVRDKISAAYAPFVQQPVATVTIVTPRPVTIAVAGEVKRPGTYVLPLAVANGQGRQFQFYKVTQLLQEAGGITQAADISQVQIQRQEPTRQTIVVNLRELLENGDLSQDLVLRDGDTIQVPTADFLDPIAIRQINSASFAPAAIAPFPVVIVGEVFNPGTHIMGQQPGMAAPGDLGEPPTITQAIKLAGGITPNADLRNIELQRLSQSGELQTLEVDLWQLLQAGDATQDVTLQPGDSIVIPTARQIDPADIASVANASFSPATMTVNVVGEVEQPGAIEVPIDTTLNQAILVAGGFDAQRANMSSVELLRLNPNGTVSRRQIKVNFQAGINEVNNPILERDDVVVIRRSALTQVGDGLEEVFRPVGGLIGVANILNIINTLTEDDDNNN